MMIRIIYVSDIEVAKVSINDYKYRSLEFLNVGNIGICSIKMLRISEFVR